MDFLHLNQKRDGAKSGDQSGFAHPLFCRFLRNKGNVTSWKREEDKRDGGKDNMKTC